MSKWFDEAKYHVVVRTINPDRSEKVFCTSRYYRASERDEAMRVAKLWKEEHSKMDVLMMVKNDKNEWVVEQVL